MLLLLVMGVFRDGRDEAELVLDVSGRDLMRERKRVYAHSNISRHHFV
jgi:hypothetical protein